jgi:hypothetical protein
MSDGSEVQSAFEGKDTYSYVNEIFEIVTEEDARAVV